MNKEKREIIGLALLLEEITDYAVFISYSGHVKSLEISVRKNEKEYQKVIFKGEFYIRKNTREKERYKMIKEYLEKEIKKASEIK